MGYHCSETERVRDTGDGLGIMGINNAMTANRVSYWLDLKGGVQKTGVTNYRTD